MEQLDPEDGLAVWDFTEGSDAAGGLASPSRAWRRGALRDVARLESRPLESVLKA